jgi:hypothetical protein
MDLGCLDCSSDFARRQRALDLGPEKNVVVGPGEFDIRHSNSPSLANVIAADFEDHGSLFDGVWEIRTHGSFVVETHRMNRDDKAAALIPGSRKVEPSTLVPNCANADQEFHFFLIRRISQRAVCDQTVNRSGRKKVRRCS